MHAILVLLGSSAPFEDFILSTLYNPLDIDRISINSSLFIRYRCRLFYPVDIYLYICLFRSMISVRISSRFFFGADPEEVWRRFSRFEATLYVAGAGLSR